MKKLVLLILIATTAFSSCKKDAAKSSYDQSFAKFQSFKKSANNSYTFTAVRYSIISSAADVETKITVNNGAITVRDITVYSYVVTPGVDTLTKTIVKQWHEENNTLNTHSGYWYLTLDEVYARAKSEWLSVDPKKNVIDFETKNNGMISTAGYVPNGCADDCFNGIFISSIKPL